MRSPRAGRWTAERRRSADVVDARDGGTDTPAVVTAQTKARGLSVRTQYYFRRSERGLLAWDVDRLVVLSRKLPQTWVPLSQIRELDEDW